MSETVTIPLCAKCMGTIDEYLKPARELAADNAALKRYAVHRIGCESNEGKACDCGLDALLKTQFTGGTTPAYFSAQNKEDSE